MSFICRIIFGRSKQKKQLLTQTLKREMLQSCAPSYTNNKPKSKLQQPKSTFILTIKFVTDVWFGRLNTIAQKWLLEYIVLSVN